MISSDLFKKFTLDEEISSISIMTQREKKNLYSELQTQLSELKDYWEDILPRQSQITIALCHNHIRCFALEKTQVEVLFFQHYEGLYFPHLKLLHKYPFMLPRQVIDQGAIKHIIAGANVMCQGVLTSGDPEEPELEKGTMVGIYAEGKEHALAVGIMLISSKDIITINKGPCISNVHRLGDGLWCNPLLKPGSTL